MQVPECVEGARNHQLQQEAAITEINRLFPGALRIITRRLISYTFYSCSCYFNLTLCLLLDGMCINVITSTNASVIRCIS